MKSPNHLYNKESKTLCKKDIPKINFDNKLLSLPIINKNICFSERPINLNKKSLEGYKPKEDKKIRNKIETKFNNGETNLNIKYLSLNQKNNPDSLLYLLKKIKIKENNNYKNKLINEDLFNNNSNYLIIILIQIIKEEILTVKFLNIIILYQKQKIIKMKKKGN